MRERERERERERSFTVASVDQAGQSWISDTYKEASWKTSIGGKLGDSKWGTSFNVGK
jgi:hypothetical protein